MKFLIKLFSEKPWSIPLIIFALTSLTYFNSLSNDFVLDDFSQLVENPLVQSIGNIPKLLTGSTFYSGSQMQLEGLYYRPMMMTMFSIVHQFFGLNPSAYHFISIVFHATNGYLVYLILKKFFKPDLSLLVSLFFVVHPINVEAVVYISDLQDLLFNFFGLLSLYILLYKDIYTSKYRNSILVFLFLGLLSKEVAIVYVVICCFWLFINKSRAAKSFTIASLCVCSVYGLLRINAIGFPKSDPVIPIVSASVGERLLTIPKIIWFYISTYTFPKNLAITQNWVVKDFTVQDVVIPILGALASTFVLFKLLKKTDSKHKPILYTAIVLLITSVGMHLHIFPLNATVADRWFYSSSIALSIIIALVISSHSKFRAKLQIVLVLIILGLSIRSFIRVENWKNGYTLFTHDYQLVGPNYMIDSALGVEYLKKKQFDLAIHHLELSTSLVDKWGISWNNLGIAYELSADLGKIPEEYYAKSFTAYQNAIKYPAGSSPFINMGRLLLKYPAISDQEIQNYFRATINKYPQDQDLWYMLSKFERLQKRYPEALFAASQFVRLYPTDVAKNWYNEILLESQQTKN